MPAILNATLGNTEGNTALCWPESDWLSVPVCVGVCTHVCVLVFECICTWLCVKRGHACIFEEVFIYMRACNNTHNKPVQKREKATNMHTGDFNVCLLQQDWGLYMLVQRKKKKVNKKQMFKRRTTFTPLFLCPLCWAVMWLLYSISFLDIFYALNVVSLWRLDAHWKIFFGNSQRERKCTFFFDHDSLSLVNSFFFLQITCWFPFAKLKVRLNYTHNSVIGLKRKYVSMVVSFL